VCACSTAHLPRAENDAIDRLIQYAPRRRGRIIVDHPILSIEAALLRNCAWGIPQVNRVL
ncbi:hypothetical protein SxD43FB_24320, partial [Sphingobium sp. D43FB]